KLRRAVEPLVERFVSQNCLNVFTRLGERDRFDKLLRIAVMALLEPVADTVGASVVGSERIFELAVVLVDHRLEIASAELEVDGRRIKLARVVALELDLFGNVLPYSRQQLHQPNGICARDRRWIEF